MRISNPSVGVRLVSCGPSDVPGGINVRSDLLNVERGHEPAAGQWVTPSICLDRMLRRGGMGSLWLAEHRQLKMLVVVKFIATELLGNSDIVARFQREAAATMAARSPHVVKILDYGLTERAVPFLAMEYLAGEDLAAKIDREGRVPPWEFAEILKQTCTGLAAAHAHGIVHRDIKPENIFLNNPERELTVKILDFGIAKSENALFGLGATNTGAFMGTVHYMSPEQTMGAKSVDHRTDLWALGVVTYLALTGVRPFDAEAIGALVEDITCSPIIPPSQHVPALGLAIDRWMCQALARDPEQRFESAEQMAASFNAAVIQSLVWPGASTSGPFEPEQSSARQQREHPFEAVEEQAAHGTLPSSTVQSRRPPSSVGSFVRSLAAPAKPQRRAIGIGLTAVCLLATFAIALKAFLGLGTATTLNRASSPAVPSVAAKVAAPPQTANAVPVTAASAALELGSASPVASARAVSSSAPVEHRAAPRAKPKRGLARADNPFDGSY